MSWYPLAIRRPVARFNPGGSIAQQITPRRFVFHTAVSGARSLFDYFNQAGNPCSTWYVAADGYCEQYVDSDYRAPAQLEGNHDCLSVESQDIGDGFPAWTGSHVPAWTAAQIERLADISAWVNQVHGIPLVALPDSVNGRAGFGYHRLGINPWRVANGELWSNATGKVCPGDNRIAQIPQILTAAAQGSPPPPPTRWETDKMYVGQDQFDGKLYVIAGGTRRELAGQIFADLIMGVTGQVALLPFNHDMVMGFPDVYRTENEIEAAIAPLADDEAKILAAIAAIDSIVTTVTDADLARIATAVADEQAARLVS